MPDEFVVRKFVPSDRAAVRRINYDTALMGEPAKAFFGDEEIFKDALTVYFTDYEPQSCFVVEVNGQVAGYLIGACDTRVLDRVMSFKILPGLLLKALFSGALFSRTNRSFVINGIRSFFCGELFVPDFYKDYPATLHINMDKDFRGKGLGERLIGRYFDYLKAEKVKGVRCSTMSARAGKFFSRQGFTLLYAGKRSYLRHILNNDIKIETYGKILT